MSEDIGRCGGDEKNEWPCRNNKKSNAKMFLLEFKNYSYRYIKPDPGLC